MVALDISARPKLRSVYKMSVAAGRLLSLVLFPAAIGAACTNTPHPLAVTASDGPIIASYDHAAATTTLAGYTSATASSSVAPSATVIANGTLPACKPVQYDFPAGTGGNATRAAAVKEAYLYAWDAYAEYAFGYDELQPLSKGATNDWCEYCPDLRILGLGPCRIVQWLKHECTRWMGRNDC